MAARAFLCAQFFFRKLRHKPADVNLFIKVYSIYTACYQRAMMPRNWFGALIARCTNQAYTWIAAVKPAALFPLGFTWLSIYSMFSYSAVLMHLMA